MTTQEINPFENALNTQKALLSAEPVDNDLLHLTLAGLETIGYEAVQSGSVDANRFAHAMHEIYSGVADLEIEPPLNEAQVALIAGKASTYSFMCETMPTGEDSSRHAGTVLAVR